MEYPKVSNEELRPDTGRVFDNSYDGDHSTHFEALTHEELETIADKVFEAAWCDLD